MGGKFNKEGTTTLDGDPEDFSFAILQPPTDVRHGDQWVSIDTGNETTSDGYLVPVVSDLSAALVVPLDRYTEAVLRVDGTRIKNKFLQEDFEGAYWVPIKNIRIKAAPAGGPVVLTEEAVKAKEYEKLMEEVSKAENPFRKLQPPAREPQPKAEPDVLRFHGNGKEVTVDRLSAWVDRRYPHGVDYPALLMELRSSQGFSFSGPEDARAMAATALVLELREKRRAQEGAAATVAAPDEEQGRRRRRKCKRAAGPSCPVWRPRLTQRNEYWDHAFNFRMANRIITLTHFNQNVAVLLLDGEQPIIKANEMQFHSEQQILWTLTKRGIDSDCPILGLFSERKPCQEICQKQVLPQLCRVNNGVPFDVFFATDYYNTTAGMKSENNRHELIRSYAQAGYFDDF